MLCHFAMSQLSNLQNFTLSAGTENMSCDIKMFIWYIITYNTSTAPFCVVTVDNINFNTVKAKEQIIPT